MPSLRDYQTPAVDFLVNHARAFLIAPAGSGKTTMAAAALQRLCRLHADEISKVVWTANTLEQVDQAVQTLREFPCETDVEIQVECVASQPDTRDADVVIMDEGHHGPAATWRSLVLATSPRAYLWGLSATPWHDTDTERNQDLVQFFRNFHEVDRFDVLGAGHLVEGRVQMWDLDLPGEFDAAIKALAEPEIEKQMRRYRLLPEEEQKEIRDTITQRALWRFTPDTIRTNPKRQAKIHDLIRSETALGHSCLTLVGSIDHGEEIARQTGGVLCTSRMPKKQRQATIEGARSGDIRNLIATSLADEGMDIPRLSRLILACGGRSSTKLTQRIGRILRPHETKEAGVCHDFLDRGAELAHAQAWARIRRYRDLGYQIEGVE